MKDVFRDGRSSAFRDILLKIQNLSLTLISGKKIFCVFRDGRSSVCLGMVDQVCLGMLG